MRKKRFLAALALTAALFGGVSAELASSIAAPIEVSASAVKSSDSSLSKLSISPGTLNPAFSPSVHEYTASVDADVTAISVAASPNDSSAAIAAVTGAKSITPGQNTVQVVVGAADGTSTTYTITVTCGTAGDTAADAATGEEGAGDAEGGNRGDGAASDVNGKEQAVVSFDENGYLIYDGDTYIPSEMMPEGDYVSLSKYNKLYEQNQSQKSTYMRMVIALAVLSVFACIVILNLVLKLRDCRQDMQLHMANSEKKAIKTTLPEERKDSRKEPKPEKKASPEKEKDKSSLKDTIVFPTAGAEKKKKSGKNAPYQEIVRAKKSRRRADEQPEPQTRVPDTTMIPDLKLPDEIKLEALKQEPVKPETVKSDAVKQQVVKPQTGQLPRQADMQPYYQQEASQPQYQQPMPQAMQPQYYQQGQSMQPQYQQPMPQAMQPQYYQQGQQPQPQYQQPMPQGQPQYYQQGQQPQPQYQQPMPQGQQMQPLHRQPVQQRPRPTDAQPQPYAAGQQPQYYQQGQPLYGQASAAPKQKRKAAPPKQQPQQRTARPVSAPQKQDDLEILDLNDL